MQGKGGEEEAKREGWERRGRSIKVGEADSGSRTQMD